MFKHNKAVVIQRVSPFLAPQFQVTLIVMQYEFLKYYKKLLTYYAKSVEFAPRLRGKFIKKREDKLCGHFEEPLSA
ncbi:hypothetical protein, partial [Fluoribacter gormanii]